MSYRKLFLLIAFAPLACLLFVRDAQPWDEFPQTPRLGLWTGAMEVVSGVLSVLTIQRYRPFRPPTGH